MGGIQAHIQWPTFGDNMWREAQLWTNSGVLSVLEILRLNLLVTVCDIQLICFIWDLVFVCLGHTQ